MIYDKKPARLNRAGFSIYELRIFRYRAKVTMVTP